MTSSNLHTVQILGLTVLCAVGLVLIWQSVSATEARVRSLLEIARRPVPLPMPEEAPVPTPPASPPLMMEPAPAPAPAPVSPEIQPADTDDEIRVLSFAAGDAEEPPSTPRIQFAEQ